MDVVGIERPCMDCLLHVRELPKPNEGSEILETSWQGGGKVATALVALGRLGARCAMIGEVGNDSYGKFCIKDFEDHNVDTSHLYVVEDGQTPLSFVLSDDETKGRSIMGKHIPMTERDLTEEDIELICQAKILHLCSPHKRCVEAAKIAHEHGVKVAYDGDYYHSEVDAILPYIDYFIGSEFFYDSYFENDPETDMRKRFEKIMAIGPEICVFTFGSKGEVAANKDEFHVLEATDVPRIVDTVGAGDVYHGAFIFGLLQEGWDLKKVAEFAGVVASMKCMYIGGRAGIPNYETALHYYETGELLESDIPARIEKYSEFNY